MPYVKPQDVKSPKSRWHLIEVLLDGESGGCAYALGQWDGIRCIGFRWNGTDDKAVGNPQSRGRPTWTILDSHLYPAVIALLKDKKDKQAIACAFLGISP